MRSRLMIKSLGVLLAAWGLLSGSGAWAAGTGTGFIAGVNSEVGSGKFSTSGGHANAPACATTGRWAVDVTTARGQAMWATILTAYSQHLSVYVLGIGTCDVWGDSETVQAVQLP